MNAKLKKLSEKSLIFLVWKQRNVINAFAKRIKALLADHKRIKALEMELISAKATAKICEERYQSMLQSYEKLVDVKIDLLKEVATLKGRLAERSVGNAK
jgi:outer membrane protein TolC